jgi:hypothetical protein
MQCMEISEQRVGYCPDVPGTLESDGKDLSTIVIVTLTLRTVLLSCHESLTASKF